MVAGSESESVISVISERRFAEWLADEGARVARRRGREWLNRRRTDGWSRELEGRDPSGPSSQFFPQQDILLLAHINLLFAGSNLALQHGELLLVQVKSLR